MCVCVQEYHRVYSMYISSKDNLAAAEGLLYNIKSENENLRHELATKEVRKVEFGDHPPPQNGV